MSGGLAIAMARFMGEHGREETAASTLSGVLMWWWSETLDSWERHGVWACGGKSGDFRRSVIL